jgi:isochorismate hydrolase
MLHRNRIGRLSQVQYLLHYQIKRNHSLDTLVLAGLTSHHCVNTTARMSGNLGFRTIVVSDATAAYDRTGPDGVYWTADQVVLFGLLAHLLKVHSVSLACINEEFASVVSTKELLKL